MAGCHTLLRKLPQISQIYTETFSKKVLCALRILWEFLYTNLEWKICGKQPLHQPSHQYKPKGVQRSPLHQPNNLYKTTKAEALTFALVLFSPSAPTDPDIRTDRRRHPQRPTQTSATTDAGIRIDRRRHPYRPTQMLVTTDAISEDVTYACRKIEIRIIKIGNTAYSDISRYMLLYTEYSTQIKCHCIVIP